MVSVKNLLARVFSGKRKEKMTGSKNEEAAASAPPELPEIVKKFIFFAENWISEESAEAAHNHKFLDSDIFITTAPKAGTTWTETIVHGLRSNMSLDFDEVHEIIPWSETAKDVGIDLNAMQQWSPRLFKTHSEYRYCPKNVKHIVVVRDPTDCAVSFYHFHKNWVYPENEMSLEMFMKYLALNMGNQSFHSSLSSFWHFLADWYPHRNDSNILWLHFEDIKKNQREVIKLIADFTGIAKDNPKLQEDIIGFTSIENMKKNKTKFDAHFLKLKRNVGCGLDKNAGLSDDNEGLVRSGKVGANTAELTDEYKQKLKQRWIDVCQPVTGFNSYAEMKAAVNKELGRPY